jgi:hypothetical protein
MNETIFLEAVVAAMCQTGAAAEDTGAARTAHATRLEAVIKAIGNNEERKEITARRHKILTWKTLSNKER